MAEGEGNSLLIQSIMEGGKAFVGAPAALVTNAIKVVGRLVGAVGAIPEAMIKSKAQGISDQADARSAIVKAVSRAAAKKAASDPTIIDRSLEVWAGDLLQRQENREAVAARAVEFLQAGADVPPILDENPSASEVDDDWLNIFTRYSEDATTERMRHLWARVAAGEMRRPGSFSLRTLRLVSEMDQATAKDFADLFSRAIADVIPTDSSWQNGSLYDLALRMQVSGLLLNGPGTTQRTLALNDRGFAIFAGRKHGLVIFGEAGGKISIDVMILSSQALELATLLDEPDEKVVLRDVAKSMEKNGIDSMVVQEIYFEGKTVVTCGEYEVVWPAD